MWSIPFLNYCAPDNIALNMGIGKVTSHNTDWVDLQPDAQVKLEQHSDSLLAYLAILCYFFTAHSVRASHLPGTILHGSNKAGNSPRLLAKQIVL